MSDFDKEAEREKLREKFARDEEKRAETRRMSELLLKGATMTNKHCDRCSDPLFRYNGQTFCPSCQAGADAATAEPQSETETQSADGSAMTPEPTENDVTGTTHAEETPEPIDTPQSTDERLPPQSAADEASRRAQFDDNESVTPLAEQQRPRPSTDLATARQSLTRTVTRFAQEAERTEDPRRARELLAAAREAAATLAELD